MNTEHFNKFMNGCVADLVKTLKIENDVAESYVNNLYLLNDQTVFLNFNFLKKRKDEFIEKLNGVDGETRRIYLESIVGVLSLVKDTHLYKSLFRFYKDELENKKSEESDDNQSEVSVKGYGLMEWDEIMKIWTELYNEVNEFRSNKTITLSQFEKILDLLILSLFVLIPPPKYNSDYQRMYILPKEYDIKSLDLVNFSYLDPWKGEFIFSVKKSLTVEPVKIPPKLMDIISFWLKVHPLKSKLKFEKVEFFVTGNGKARISLDFISERLKKSLGSNIGSTTLKNIYMKKEVNKISMV